MIKNPKYSELVDIILDLTIDEFYLLKSKTLQILEKKISFFDL